MRRGRTGGTAGRRRGEVGGVGPCAATGRRRAAENGGGRRAKRNIGGIQEKKGCREGIASAAFLGFYHLSSH